MKGSAHDSFPLPSIQLMLFSMNDEMQNPLAHAQCTYAQTILELSRKVINTSQKQCQH